MSVVYAEITLRNGGDVFKAQLGEIKADAVRQMTVEAMVDTGASTIVINEEIRDALGLLDKGCGIGGLADGKAVYYQMAGPLDVWWKDRLFTCNAAVLPGAKRVLLGALALEDMDLTINPKRELVGVHGDIVMHTL